MIFSAETSNDFDTQLFECSILIISILLKQYKEKIIDINDFKKNTALKINYVLNNIDIIKDSMKKEDIENLLNECIAINNTI